MACDPVPIIPSLGCCASGRYGVVKAYYGLSGFGNLKYTAVYPDGVNLFRRMFWRFTTFDTDHTYSYGPNSIGTIVPSNIAWTNGPKYVAIQNALANQPHEVTVANTLTTHVETWVYTGSTPIVVSGETINPGTQTCLIECSVGEQYPVSEFVDAARSTCLATPYPCDVPCLGITNIQAPGSKTSQPLNDSLIRVPIPNAISSPMHYAASMLAFHIQQPTLQFGGQYGPLASPGTWQVNASPDQAPTGSTQTRASNATLICQARKSRLAIPEFHNRRNYEPIDVLNTCVSNIATTLESLPLSGPVDSMQVLTAQSHPLFDQSCTGNPFS